MILLHVLAAVLAASSYASAQDPAGERLDTTPRHHEWVSLDRDGRKLRCFVAFPEVEGKAMAVLVIHENKGLTDWVREVADQLAEAGYVAIAPDLLSGMGPEGGDTDAFASPDAATKALYGLEPERVAADLAAAADHAARLPACDGRLAVAGFCWGGSQSFDFATRRKDLEAAFVFYGRAPEDEGALARIECPVYGFYGEKDERVNATIPATEAAMAKLGKTFEPEVYPGAGHGFLRRGEEEEASGEDRMACRAAWRRWLMALDGAR